MTPEQFCYWLQGRSELDPTPPTPEQWQSIRAHLAAVFVKVTPPVIPVSPGRDNAEVLRRYEWPDLYPKPIQYWPHELDKTEIIC